MLFHDADREQKAKKTRPSRSAPYPARPLPFPPPTSSNAPRLPNELLTQILKDLNPGKSTLAICMRVSLLFNQLAAPLLYRSVHVSSHLIESDRHPLAIPKSMLPLSRISSSKADNLKHVKYVMVDQHDGHKCQGAIGPMQSERASKSVPIAISCLRFNIGVKQKYTLPGVHKTVMRDGDIDMRCGVLSNFIPTTLVFNGTRGRSPLHGCPIPATGTKAVIAIIQGNRSRRTYYRAPGHRGDPVDHVIYIVWELLAHTYEERDFACGLLNILDTGIAKAYTVVNGGDAVMQEVRKFRESAVSSFKFIGKKDYLATHDWKGVLTPKEAYEWSSINSN